jgi:cyclopropane-fatty-acyl-phospholipid synthase
VRGRQHSLSRDRNVIAHHYDLTADFYRLLLDPAMAYSCARWESAGPGCTLADAQRAKLDSICRKVGLADVQTGQTGQVRTTGQAGKTLLDLGCGWGADKWLYSVATPIAAPFNSGT